MKPPLLAPDAAGFTEAGRPPLLAAHVTRFTERIRRPVSIGFALLMLTFIALTKPRHYEDVVYRCIELIGYLLVFVAVTGRTWSIFFIGGRKNRKLCQHGPYACCRNPLYFFSFLGLIGVGLSAQSLPALLIAVPVFLVYYRILIRTEETRLEQLFGEAYRTYANQVPRFWPRWRPLQVPKELTVNVRDFSRSLADASCFLLILIGLEILEAIKVSGRVPILELPW